MVEIDKDKKLGQDCLKMAWYLFSILVFTTIIVLCPVGTLYLYKNYFFAMKTLATKYREINIFK